MALSSSEKYLLEKQLRRLNSKVCLLKEEDQDIQAELDLKADLVGGVVPTDQLPIDQDIIDALNNANAPDGTNYFTTLADLSSIIPGTLINVAANYSALPAANTVPGEFYWVENAQGTSWLPGGLGGTYYSNGLYYSNGTTWIYTDMPYNATQAEVDGGLNNNKFVTPNTFENAAKWGTKQNTLTFDSTPTNGSNNPVTSDGVFDALALKQDTLTNPVTGTGTSGQVSYWSGTNTQAGSNNLFWDAANGRLGIGTISPTNSNHIVGQNSQLRITVGSGGGMYLYSNLPSSAFVLGGAEFSNGQIIARSTTYAGFGTFNGNFFIDANTGLTANSVFSSTTRLAIFGATGNATIGNNTDLSARLAIRGSGTTSATTALLVQNSTPTELFVVRDDGRLSVSGATFTEAFNVNGNIRTTNSFIVPNNGNYFSSGTLNIIYTRSTENTTEGYVTVFTGGSLNGTTGSQIEFGIGKVTFSPTSGTAIYVSQIIKPTINQTGGANGITRGLFVNPTLTAAADWRGIESVAASNANHTLLKLRNATVDVFTVKSDSKIGFFNATPVVQPTGDIPTALSNLGLVSSPLLYKSATATLTTAGWSLVGGVYEQSISDANITTSSVVDIIPDNAAASAVSAAQILPRTDSSSGAVKVYATNLPTANIGVTLNIWN